MTPLFSLEKPPKLAGTAPTFLTSPEKSLYKWPQKNNQIGRFIPEPLWLLSGHESVRSPSSYDPSAICLNRVKSTRQRSSSSVVPPSPFEFPVVVDTAICEVYDFFPSGGFFSFFLFFFFFWWEKTLPPSLLSPPSHKSRPPPNPDRMLPPPQIFSHCFFFPSVTNSKHYPLSFRFSPGGFPPLVIAFLSAESFLKVTNSSYLCPKRFKTKLRPPPFSHKLLTLPLPGINDASYLLPPRPTITLPMSVTECPL